MTHMLGPQKISALVIKLRRCDKHHARVTAGRNSIRNPRSNFFFDYGGVNYCKYSGLLPVCDYLSSSRVINIRSFNPDTVTEMLEVFNSCARNWQKLIRYCFELALWHFVRRNPGLSLQALRALLGDSA